MYGAGATNTKSSWANGWNNIVGHFTPGVTGGEEQHILTISEIPSHSHNWSIVEVEDTTGFVPSNIAAGGTAGATWVTRQTDAVGGNSAHNIMPRFLSLAYIMKL